MIDAYAWLGGLPLEVSVGTLVLVLWLALWEWVSGR